MPKVFFCFITFLFLKGLIYTIYTHTESTNISRQVLELLPCPQYCITLQDPKYPLYAVENQEHNLVGDFLVKL